MDIGNTFHFFLQACKFFKVESEMMIFDTTITIHLNKKTKS
jgi:hypothetical protein